MKNSNEPIRILHVFSRLNRGGAETMIMNIYRNINRDKMQFDFLCLTPDNYDYLEEIESLGGRIFSLNIDFKQRPFLCMAQILKIMRSSGPFTAVHAHSLPSVILTISRFAGIKKRISHAHSTFSEKKMNFFRKIYKGFARILLWINATELVACSKDAGVYFYGRRFNNSYKCKIIPNAIDLKPYMNLNKEDIEIKKNELGISPNSVIIGHIGSFRLVKNHAFLINLAAYFKKNKIDFKMILVGQGELFNEIKNKIKINGLEDVIMMLGTRSDIPSLLNMFDVLLLPSIFEGIPVTVIEAQAACTPCLLSDNITREVDMGIGLVEYLGLNMDLEQWFEKIIKLKNKSIDCNNVFKCIYNKGYDVKRNVKLIYELYGI